MIFLSVGLPGRFAEWCDAVLVRLAEAAGGEVVSRSGPLLGEMLAYEAIPSTLDGIGRFLVGNCAEHIVIGSRQPDAALRAVLAERNRPFIAALDDPRSAAADILDETGTTPRMAVRAVANSCVSVMQYLALPGALTLHADRARRDPADAVAAMAAHFGIAADPDTIAAIVYELPPPGTGPTANDEEALLERLPSGSRNLFDGALLGCRDLVLDGRLDQIVWTRELFLVVDGGGTPTEPLSLAGGRRVLIYGPYIHLPRGSWTARVILGFSPEAVGHTFLIDVFADAQLAATTFQPGSAGIYNADLTFSLGEPRGLGIEIRIMVESDGARGQLAFGQVVLRPLTMRGADAEPAGDDFTLALAL